MLKIWELRRCKTFLSHCTQTLSIETPLPLSLSSTERSAAWRSSWLRSVEWSGGEITIYNCTLWSSDFELELKKTEWKSSALLENTLSVPRQPWNCATLDLRSWMSDKHVNCSTFNEFHDLQISHALIANRWSLIENRKSINFYILFSHTLLKNRDPPRKKSQCIEIVHFTKRVSFSESLPWARTSLQLAFYLMWNLLLYGNFQCILIGDDWSRVELPRSFSRHSRARCAQFRSIPYLLTSFNHLSTLSAYSLVGNNRISGEWEIFHSVKKNLCSFFSRLTVKLLSCLGSDSSSLKICENFFSLPLQSASPFDFIILALCKNKCSIFYCCSLHLTYEVLECRCRLLSRCSIEFEFEFDKEEEKKVRKCKISQWSQWIANKIQLKMKRE